MKVYAILYINTDEPKNSEILSMHYNKQSAISALIKHAHYEDRDGKLLQYKRETNDYPDYQTLWNNVESTNTLIDEDIYRIEEYPMKQIVSCKIYGGLGNQLFQIFTTLAYALETNKEYMFENNVLYGSRTTTYWDTILKSISHNVSNEESFLKSFPIVGEKEYNFNEIPNINSNIMLNGYFQSYKYFIKHMDAIFNLIQLENMKNQIHSKYGSRYFNQQENNVSMHFRFGDYLTLSEYHKPLCYSYYENELNCINKNSNVLYFYERGNEDLVNQFIKRLKFVYPDMNFMPVDSELQDWEHMLLMSLCNHNIIANSTFSYFGAIFNTNENRSVYYPSKWFGEKLNKHNTKDLCLSDWVEIEAGYHSPNEVLDYWFGFEKWQTSNFDSTSEFKDVFPMWFGVSPDMKPISVDKRQSIDNMCKRFAYLIEMIAKGDKMTEDWDNTPQGLYAKMLLTDQLSRNCFRGTAKAFEYDNLAVKYALKIIDDKLYTEFGIIQFIFISTALQHSENIEHHRKMETLIQFCQDKFGEEDESLLTLKKACNEHKTVIEQFGRYPHRNEALSRESTEDELKWLQGDDLPKWANSQKK